MSDSSNHSSEAMAISAPAPEPLPARPAVLDFTARLRRALATDGHLTVEASEMDPLFDGDGDRCSRLLRLHHLARSVDAAIQREPDGRITFAALPNVTRPPHFHYVSTLQHLLPGTAPAEAHAGTSAGRARP